MQLIRKQLELKSDQLKGSGGIERRGVNGGSRTDQRRKSPLIKIPAATATLSEPRAPRASGW